MDRTSTLKNLIQFSLPLKELKVELAAFQWDSKEILEIENKHVISVLKRVESGDLSQAELIDWANLVEGRDDLAFPGGSAGSVARVIHEIANPYLFGGLTSSDFDRWISILS